MLVSVGVLLLLYLVLYRVYITYLCTIFSLVLFTSLLHSLLIFYLVLYKYFVLFCIIFPTST